MDSSSTRKTVRPAKHVTRACVGCRQRKSKCDGARPQCSNCRLHNQECEWPQEVDKRTVSSKERYTRLEQYAASLESALLRNGMTLPPQLDTSYPPDSTTMMNRNPVIPPLVPGDDSPWEESQDHPSDGLGSAQTGPLEDADIDLDVLGERFGSLQLADDGQIRFFGATSNLHIQHVGLFSLTDSKIRSVYGKEEDILRQAGLNDPVPEELEAHLLRLYFCWENPNIPVVDQSIYYTERASYRATGRPTHRYSEMLTNAMCAVGAALTRRHPRGLPESLVEFFSSRTKALLEVEMDAPCLCTVQALVILSGVEAFLTRDARGWLYSGMAMRLAVDLGLHLKPSTRKDFLKATETRLRRSVFWGAYIHDRMWSFYVGRPESLDEKHIFVEPLRATDIAQQQAAPLWHPYIDEAIPRNAPGLPSLLGEVAQYTVSLCRQMSHIRRVLYNSPYPDGSEIKSLHSAARRLRDDLLAWAEDLPSSLSLLRDSEQQQQPLRAPHVLQLHMQYYAILVVIDRPFTYGRHQPLPGLTPADVQESHIACTDAAASIVNLLQAYRYHHGARQMNIHTVHLIFTAALVHIHNVYFAPSEPVRAAARSLLQISCQVLAEIGQAYQNALRALEIITSIKSELARSIKSSRSRPGSHEEYRRALNKRARLDPNHQGPEGSSTGPETGTPLLAAPGMEGLGMLEECLQMPPSSSTLMASGSLFTEPWGWISPPDSFDAS